MQRKFLGHADVSIQAAGGRATSSGSPGFFRGAADSLPRIDGFSVAPLVRAGIDLAQGVWERAGLGP
ncbi:hypothetical protein ACOTD9_30030, partial [Achromobacter xylosoxidans]